MKTKVFRVLRFLAFLALGLGLLFLALKGVSMEELAKKLKMADTIWIPVALFAAIIGYLSRAYRWKLLIKPLNYNPSFWNTFFALMIGYTANFAFPRIGEITRCGTLKKSDKIPMDSLLGTVIIERAIDMLVLFVVLIIIFFAKMDFFGQFLTQKIFLPILNNIKETLQVSVFNWIIIAAILVLLIFAVRYLNRKFSHNPFLQKLKKIYRGVVSGLKTIARMQDRWVFTLHTLIIWVMYFLMTYVLVFALPTTSALQPIDGLFLLVIGGLGMAAPVQGGIGAFHAIIILGLRLYGIPQADAAAYAVISHESQAVLVILLGAISFIMIVIRRRKLTSVSTKFRQTAVDNK